MSIPLISRSGLMAAVALILIPVAPGVLGQEPDPTWTIDRWDAHYGLSGHPFDDHDGDGIVDYVEFGFGLNPLKPDSIRSAGIDPGISVLPDGRIRIQIWQPDFPDGIGWGEGVYGRHWFWIDLQSSDDLRTWTSIATKPGMNGGFESLRPGVDISDKQAGPSRHLVEIIDARASASRVRYYRLLFYMVS